MPVEQTAEVVDVHSVNLIFSILRVQCGAILTFRHGLIVPHDSARLLTTAIRNLNLEPKDGQHRLGFRHKLIETISLIKRLSISIANFNLAIL